MKTRTPEKEHEEVISAFEFLDSLKESGATNMLGATPYIKKQLNVSSHRAKELNLMWIRSYDPERSMDDRVELAYK